MSKERGLALVQSAVARAMIRCAAMQAENAHLQACGSGVAYGEEAFLKIIDEEGIGENDVIRLMIIQEERVSM